MQFDEIHADLRPEEKLAKAGRIPGNGWKGSRKDGKKGALRYGGAWWNILFWNMRNKWWKMMDLTSEDLTTIGYRIKFGSYCHTSSAQNPGWLGYKGFERC